MSRPSGPLQGWTHQKLTGCGKLYITINEDPQTGRLVEVFLSMGKAGGCASSQTEAIGRLVSVSLTNGIDPNVLIKQLAGISCHSHAGFGDGEISSCADAIAKALKEHLEARSSLFQPEELANVA